MIGLLLGSVILLGLMQIFASSSQSYKAQTGQYNLQHSGQFALQYLAREIRQAGYVHKPWAGGKLAAVSETSADTGTAGDLLAIQYYSDRNCFGSRNSPAGDGEVPFYLKEVRFALRISQQQLTWWCAYASTGEVSVVQANNQTLVDHIDSFQVLYGEDSDADGNPDRWVNAGNWESAENVAVVTLALLATDESSLRNDANLNYTLLDYDTGPLTGSKRREVLQTAIALRNYRP